MFSQRDSAHSAGPWEHFTDEWHCFVVSSFVVRQLNFVTIPLREMWTDTFETLMLQYLTKQKKTIQQR